MSDTRVRSLRYPVNCDANKLVVWQVAIQCVDDPIAPKVNAGLGVHPFVHVGIAQNVEPVAAVANAILRVREKTIHHLFISVRRIVFEESILFGESGRQADEIQIHAP